MYAILETGGKQYRVQEQSVLEVEALPAAPGDHVAMERVLMVADDSGVRVGTPVVGDAKVICRVLAQDRGPRISVFKYKAKENYRRLRGHRQRLTRLLVERIEVGGSPLDDAPSTALRTGRGDPEPARPEQSRRVEGSHTES